MSAHAPLLEPFERPDLRFFFYKHKLAWVLPPRQQTFFSRGVASRGNDKKRLRDNLNCFGLGLSLRNENKLFLILKKIYTEDSSRPSTHCLTKFPHNICMLKAIFMKGPFLPTSILWSNDVWKSSHGLKG